MPIIQTWPITGVGVGRKDYSARIEVSTLPLMRSYQHRSLASLYWVVPAQSYVETEIPLEQVNYLSDFYLSAYENTLIRLDLIVGGETYASQLGYQNVYIGYHSAPPFRSLTVRVWNMSDTDQYLLYSHFGIQVSEERIL